MLIEDNEYTVSSIDLTDHQKMVLAKAVAAGAIDSEMRHVDLSDEKLISARDILNDIDLINHEYTDDTMTINQSGIDVMKRDGVIDDNEELTEEGKQYASGKIPAAPDATVESLTFSDFLKSRNQNTSR
jgi:hypothetical protein